MATAFLKRITPLMSIAVAAFFNTLVTAVTFDVSASGEGMGLSDTLVLAQPGDTIYLTDDIYDEAVVNYRNGGADNPISFEGSSDALVNGDYSSRYVLITHSFIWARRNGYFPNHNLCESAACAQK